VKLFQIEEPAGGPSDPEAAGAAIGIDLCGAHALVAFAVGGNAVVLDDREGFALVLSVPAATDDGAAWRQLFEGARLRAERALARPVTHAVLALPAVPASAPAAHLVATAAEAGVEILQIAGPGDLPVADTPVLAAAILAEDLAPRTDLAAFS
jgi:hypothetical protein